MAEKDIRVLRAENRRLLRENEYLRMRLATLGEKPSASDPISLRFGKGARMAAAIHKRSYGRYLLHRIRASLAFRLFDRTRFAVRGFFLATKLRALFLWLFVLLGFGTRFLLFAGILAVLVPVLLIVSLALWGLRFIAHRKWDRMVLQLLSHAESEQICLLFAERNFEKRQYFRFMVSELEQKSMVFLVSDSFAATGFRGLKRCSSRCYAVHISYYFSLKKLLHGKIVQIY